MPYQIQRLRPQLVEALFYDNFTKSSISSNKSDAFDGKIRNKKPTELKSLSNTSA